ncbi:SPOR domain-containing protein [Nisaea sp.]|uniref:SPOR domain-containing protein n=1 Tax=Nisaea sp. TaxID=2024842 RepID=UPI0032EAC916
MRRGLLIAILPVFLSGCLPVIPPAISLATTGFTGLAFLTTGKSTADHVISAAVDENCSMLRVVFGNEPCRAYTEDDAKPLTEIVAYYPGDSDDWVDRESIPQGAVTGTSILNAYLDGTGDAEKAAAEAAAALNAETTVEDDKGRGIPAALGAGIQPLNDLTVAGFAPVDPGYALAPIELKSVVSEDDQLALPAASLASWKMSPDTDMSNDTLTTTAVSATEMSVMPVLRPGHRDPMRHDKGQPADHFVMLGSFRDKGRAEHLQEELRPAFDTADSRPVPVIMSVRIKGSLWHRVAIGPFTGKDALVMASALAPVSGKKPWAAKITN